MKLGIIDLDTSHPENWLPIERTLGCEIAGVWDAGSVHPRDYVLRFAAQHQIPRVFDSLDEMLPAVDGVVIHGCNWDTHIDQARPFVEAGKSVLLDKPLAGNLRDLKQLIQWEEQGRRIAGGSALRFSYEVQNFLKRPEEQRGRPQTVFCGCAVDEFNYGIHAYSLLSGIMGSGVVQVRHLGQGFQRRIEVEYPEGRGGILVIGQTSQWIPFYSSVVTERGVTQWVSETGKLYSAILESVLPYLKKEVDQPPVPMKHLVEPELMALAARKSWGEGNRWVKISELSDSDGGYDGKQFAEFYRKTKYP